MKRCLLLLTCIMLTYAVGAQASMDTASLPKFYFKDGKTHDFGKVMDGDQPTYRFVFKNVGKSTLFITDISLSCECFSVDWVKYPIQPGGEGWITAKFPLTGRIGTFNKLLWIVSNAMAAGGNREELMIMGNVVAGPITSKTPAVDFLAGPMHDFGKIPEGPNVDYQFVFRNKGMTPLKISNVESDCSCMVADYQKEPVAPGHAGWIKATYHTKDRPGSFDKALRIRANAVKKTDLLRVYVKGTVVPEKGIGSR